ncbi:hypothetical protein GCM10007938_12410 [Vibrio zhanjiangensis]|uniref:Uncharacterized protein n=1 Tax=Vibrio zhanjiangensis TaxID=1046128 RepID=A0ABQ6EXA9_9VIBR|nr:hypothetical protein [Vibrio zhanjiangensis]GLT17464.1 hypothetical protein GCM10007938_12410 [Vibrio zhanjiangensis]
MSQVNFGVSPTVAALESSNDMEAVIAQSSPVVQRAAAANPQASSSSSQPLFSSGFKDPLDLIDDLLSTYITSQTDAADKLSKEIEAKSKAIADINSLWGEIMVAALGNVSDADSKDGFGPGKKGRVTLSQTTLNEIDAIIRQVSGGEDNISVITNTSSTSGVTATYDQLQEMNARMTAYCDKIQVDLDTQQQEFKNMMTEISSAQEELRDVRRAVVSMSQQG